MKIVVFALLLLYSSLPLANDLETRIIGGEKVTTNESPWMASLISRGLEPAESQFCGGALIAPQWVLTAAHCLEHNDPKVVDVVLGTNDITKLDNAERIEVQAIFNHPGYSAEHVEGTSDDIALMRLATPSSQPVLKTALASQNQAFPTGTPVTIRGWGNRSTTGFESSPELYRINYKVTDVEACKKIYEIPPENEQFICAGDAKPQGFCNGDSGGPLTSIVNGEPVQVGIVSFTEKCGSTTRPDVYARVSYYADFIRNTMLAPIVPVTPPNFPVAIDGEVGSTSFTLKNITENLQVVVSNFRFEKGAGLSLGNENCSTAGIDVGKSCQVSVNWTPTAFEPLFDTLLLDAFDGSTNTTVRIPLTGKGLQPTDFGTTLDLPDTKFVIDSNVEWTVSTEHSVKGGSSMETNLQFNLRQNGDTILGAKFPSAGTLSFSTRGSNSLVALFVDDEPVTDITVKDEWQTFSTTLDKPAFVKWSLLSADDPAIVMMDAMSFEASGQTNTGTPGTTGEPDTTGTPDTTDPDIASGNSGAMSPAKSGSSGGATSWWLIVGLVIASIKRKKSSSVCTGSVGLSV